jgi:hypothetical protein
MTWSSLGSISIALIVAGAPGAARAYDVVEQFDSGRIELTVTLTGEPPAALETCTKRDGAGCCEPPLSETYVVGENRRLANVIAWIDGVKAGKAAARRTLELRAKECRFVPRVSVMSRGAEILLVNEDTALHSFHAQRGRRTVFNVVLPLKDMRRKMVADQTGLLEYSCPTGHGFMAAWTFVAEHPYAGVTGADGRIEMADVPIGKHTLTLWHEGAGERTVQVEVTKGKTAALTVELARKTHP